MKTLTGLLATIMMVGLWAGHNLAQSSVSPSGTLLVLIKGIQDQDGELMVALYSDKQPFMVGEPLLGARKSISGSAVLVRFEKVPYGHYAVAVLQDLNNNSRMDRNLLGIPSEGYGFSNNASGRCGPPTFDQASFVFCEKVQSKIIDVKYGIP